MSKLRASAAGMGVLAMAVATQLHAQGGTGLEEVIVTAQKRTESAQEVPISIAVIDADAFIREGVRDIKDMNKMSTELEMSFPAGQAVQIGIRGMQQTGNFAPTADTLAAVHMDGAFLSSFWGLNGLMYDLDRVEVLSGPQGTLYGRNTAAGAVNLITKRPGRNFEGNASVEYGTQKLVRLNGGISVPLSDTFSMRVAGQKYTRDAFFSDGGGEQDMWGARVSGLWTPTEQDEVYFTVDKVTYDNTNESGTLLGLNESARLPNGNPAPALALYRNSPTLRDPYDTLAYITQRGFVYDGQNTQKNWGFMGQYTHDFDAFSTTVQYSHRKLEGVSRSATRTPTQFSPSVLPNVITSDTVELRFVSSGDGSFDWVGGLFYTEADNIGWFATPIADKGRDPVTGLNVSWCPCTSGFFPNSGSMYSYAAYGQGTWTPVSKPQLHFTAGLRYTYDYKDATLGYQVGGLPIFAFGIPQMPAEVQALLRASNTVDIANGDNTRTWDAVQWRVGVEYDVTDTSMLYLSVATGYKSGGLTFGLTPELDPEDLLAYELGSKNRFFDNTVQLNVSAWWYDYTDLEGSVLRLLPTPYVLPGGTLLEAVGSTTNVGKVNMGGLSADLQWAFTQNDQLGLSVTHVYSKVKDGKEVLPNGQVNTVFNEGERLGDAPKWAALARYSHTFVFASGSSLQPALKYQWQSEKIDRSQFRPQAYVPNNRTPWNQAIPARGILDFSTLISSPDNRTDLTLYVNNVTDKRVINTQNYDINPASPTYGLITGSIGEPRTFGVILKSRF